MGKKVKQVQLLKPEPAKKKPLVIVGVGASAGGLEAIESFFKNMPPDSGMAFVVIQHLSPDYKSLMVELLSRKTSIPVQRAEDGVAVKPDHIYLIPPKKNLTIFHGKLLLQDQKPREGINLPVDVFLRSLAEDQGENAVAIILSGTGSDGTRGVRAVKEWGGLVMVQDEISAKFDGMPRAASSTGVADFVLPPEEMPAQLLAWLAHPYATRQDRSTPALGDETGLTRLFSLLRAKTRVDFTYYKPSTILRRIERRIAVNQAANLDAYVRYAEETPAEISALYRELLIGVTSFFRDPEIMQTVREQVMPEILERSSGRELRFWVAGCSTGEEAYSLAILAREVMEEKSLARDVKIFATDIDRDAVARAGAGIYPESIAADLSPAVLGKYFYSRGDTYHVTRTIREMVVFAQHNLLKDPPFTRIDLVSCRNLLIYLQTNLQQRALEMFNFALKPGGFLLLGSSETVGDMEDHFEPLDRKARIYRAAGKHSGGHLEGVKIKPDEETRQPLVTVGFSRTPRTASRENERLLVRLLESLSESHLPLTVVVNEHLEILYSLGNSSGIFSIPSGRVVYDISKMVKRDLAIPLATGIQKVFRTGEDLVYSNVRLQEDQKNSSMRLRLRLLPGRKSEDPLVLVFFERVAESRQVAESAPAEYDLSEETSQRMQDLEQELQFTRENLQATIEELETSNEELQATNEELLASNEELQSTNEELQSTNEELFTVNSEYQNKIIELTEVQNDVENLLLSSRIGILILDEDLGIRRYSPQAGEAFHLVDSDVGRPLKHITHRLLEFDPLEAASQVQKTGQPREKDVRTEDGRWLLIRMLPYQVGPKVFSGVVITLIDITPVKRVEDALQQSELQYQNLFNSMVTGFALHEIILDGRGRPCDYRFLAVNPAFEELTGLKSADIIGRRILEIAPETEKEWIEIYGRVAETGEAAHFEKHSRVLGRYYDVVAYRPARGQFACTFVDVTQRRMAQQALLERETDLQRSQEIARLGSWRLDTASNQVEWTEELYKMYDFDPTLPPPPYTEHMKLFTPESWQKLSTSLARTRETGIPYELELETVRRDGSNGWMWVRGEAVRDDQGRITGLWGAAQDITLRKQLECELKEQQAQQQNLYQLLADAEKIAGMGSWTWDPASDLVNWSENLFKLFGLDPAQGAPSFAEHEKFYTPESMKTLKKAVAEALEKGRPYALELEAVKADGKIMKCLARGQAEIDQNGSVKRLFGSLQELAK